MRLVYLDNAATTSTDPEVFKAMKPFFLKKYGNVSEFHRLGREAKKAVEVSRQKLASFLGAEANEIIFTGSATESINLSHKGLIEALQGEFKGKKKPHIITSSIEHKAVLETCQHLESLAKADVTHLSVDSYGRIDLEALEKEIRPETVLVSIIYVNNEVGTIQSIREIGALVKKNNRKIYFHTDATQAIQYLNCNVDFLNVDLLSLTGHKIYAPKGVGALYVREGVPLARQIDGGGQESGLRSGTENVPYIIGLGKAVELIEKSKNNNPKKVQKLREKLIKRVLKIPGVKLTGHPVKRAPHIASFIFEGVEGEAVVLRLSDVGICISSGSACTSSDLNPSHVLTAMGIPPEKSHGSLRFSLGKDTCNEEVDYLIEKLPGIVKDLRKMAPDLKDL